MNKKRIIDRAIGMGESLWPFGGQALTDHGNQWFWSQLPTMAIVSFLYLDSGFL